MLVAVQNEYSEELTLHFVAAGAGENEHSRNGLLSCCGDKSRSGEISLEVSGVDKGIHPDFAPSLDD